MHLCLQTPFSDGNNATHQWNSTAILFSDSYLLGVPFSILCSFNLFLPLCLGVFVYMRLFFKPSLSVSGHKLLVCVCVCVCVVCVSLSLEPVTISLPEMFAEGAIDPHG